MIRRSCSTASADFWRRPDDGRRGGTRFSGATDDHTALRGWLTDRRITWLRHDNAGRSAARSHGAGSDNLAIVLALPIVLFAVGSTLP